MIHRKNPTHHQYQSAIPTPKKPGSYPKKARPSKWLGFGSRTVFAWTNGSEYDYEVSANLLAKAGKQPCAASSKDTQPNQPLDEIEQKGSRSDSFEPATAFDSVNRAFFRGITSLAQAGRVWSAHGISLVNAQEHPGVRRKSFVRLVPGSLDMLEPVSNQDCPCFFYCPSCCPALQRHHLRGCFVYRFRANHTSDSQKPSVQKDLVLSQDSFTGNHPPCDMQPSWQAAQAPGSGP